MRQAGRYMASYRTLRAKYSLLELVKTPELACAVTLQPIQAFNLDAAIIFSDILPILETIGLRLNFVQGEGPILENPIRTTSQIQKLLPRPLQETVGFTLEAIKLVKPELKVPLIGFSGAPFTLACYAIEGSSSREHRLTKQLMYTEPEAWSHLMDTLVQLTSDYLVAQAHSGADVLQIFDSWAGALSPQDYQRFVLKHTKKLIHIAKSTSKPVIYFSTGTSSYLNLLTELSADAYSVDWRISLKQAHQTLNKPIQGNLDPLALLAPWPELKQQTDFILKQAPKTGFIFNLGHGVLQQTPEDNIRRLTDLLEYPNQNH